MTENIFNLMTGRIILMIFYILSLPLLYVEPERGDKYVCVEIKQVYNPGENKFIRLTSLCHA